MNLNIFGKHSKESQEDLQTQEIKQAASIDGMAPPQKDFVNPFKKNETTPEPTMSNNPTQSNDEFNLNAEHDELFSSQEAPKNVDPNLNNLPTPSTEPIENPTNLPGAEIPPETVDSSNLNNKEIQETPPETVGSSNLNNEEIQEMIDETVEKIIDEKWDKVVSNVEKVVKWKDELESQLNLVKEDLVNVKDTFESLEKKITNKIGSYDKGLMDVGSEIKALEKIFQKITPTLVNNVNELSKIASDFKEKNSSTQIEDKKDQS